MQAQKDATPEELFHQACGIGAEIQEVKGSVWLKAKSKEAAGQFPASVSAKAPDQLMLQVTNLVGGTEAMISIKGQKYTIDVPNKKARSETGYGSWGGIPLHWATDLFLGKIPCPSAADRERLKISKGADQELVVETPTSLGTTETFTYRFRSWEGAPWPESLKWERKGAAVASVDFKFEEPEEKTRSPRRWEAASQRGEVKVRWKDRESSG